MTRSYVLHPEAFNDLRNIWSFIAKDSIDDADRVREEIYDTIRFLADHPHTGQLRTDITRQPFRFRRVYSYVIAYAPEETPVLILAVIHGRRSPRVIAAILRNRW